MKLPLRSDLRMPLSEVARILEGTLSPGSLSEITGVCLDTRTLKAGDLFFAIPATRDGHEFVATAFQNGASAAVVERSMAGGPTIQVKNSLEALKTLGRSVRRNWGRPVIGIGGSNGKTTTKEMTAALIGTAKNVLKAPGNWNNVLGIPLTLFMLRAEHEVAVLELGINDMGEMEDLTAILEPDIALLTLIGPEHLEKLRTVEDVARENGKLLSAVEEHGAAVINLDDHRIADLAKRLNGRKITVSTDAAKNADVVVTIREDLGRQGYELDVKYGSERLALRSPFLGKHNVQNLACALGVALSMETPSKGLQAGLLAAERPEMRLDLIELPRNIRVVNDCYNANPSSMAAALEVVAGMSGGRKIAVLGDMLEMGEIAARLHRDVGVRVAHLKFDRLFLFGRFAPDVAQGAVQGGMSHAQIHVSDQRDLLAHALWDTLLAGDNVLIKGSRGMRMEEITEHLKTQSKEIRT